MKCILCHKEQAKCRNLCWNCYYRTRYRKQAGIPIDKPVVKKADPKMVFMLMESGMSQSEIARKLGVSRQRISQIVRK